MKSWASTHYQLVSGWMLKYNNFHSFDCLWLHLVSNASLSLCDWFRPAVDLLEQLRDQVYTDELFLEVIFDQVCSYSCRHDVWKNILFWKQQSIVIWLNYSLPLGNQIFKIGPSISESNLLPDLWIFWYLECQFFFFFYTPQNTNPSQSHPW